MSVELKSVFMIHATDCVSTDQSVTILHVQCVVCKCAVAVLKFSHTSYRALGLKLIPVYRQSVHR